MKKLLLGLMFVLFVGTGFAYTPTSQDSQTVMALVDKVTTMSQENGEIWMNKLFGLLRLYIVQGPDNRHRYLFEQLVDYFDSHPPLFPKEIIAEEGMIVNVDYILWVDGIVLDTSIKSVAIENDIYVENRPYELFNFQLGGNAIIKGFDDAIYGMSVGDVKTVVVSPEDGYGEWDATKLVTFDRDVLPNFAYEIGVAYRTPNGYSTVVYSKSDTEVVFDINHPLAGKDLIFEIKFMGVSLLDEEVVVEENQISSDFVDCLNQKNVTVYIISTCPHCTSQKELFGDYFEQLNVINCSEDGHLCLSGITGVPTWRMDGKDDLVGTQTLESLSEFSGCGLE